MKSLILWNACKYYASRACTRLKISKINVRYEAILFLFLFFFGCSEKFPNLPLSGNLVNFDSVSVTSDLMSDTTIFDVPYVGSNSYLVVGDDDNLTAYAILSFNDMGSPLDTLSLDSIISCELILRTGSYLPVDTLTPPNLGMLIYSMDIMGDGIDAWTEDSSNSSNFNLDDYILTELCTHAYSDSDTLEIDLPKTLITNWQDTSKSHYGIVVKTAAGSDAGLGIIYSGETSYYPYMRISYYVDGDTVIAALTTDEDVSITNYKKQLETTPQSLLISSGKAAFTFLKFNVDEVITDKNLFIAGANLSLHVNPDLTKNYDKSYTVYVSLLDSTDWDDLAYSPSTSSYVTTRSIAPGDSVFVLKIPSTIQLFTSGYNGNFGVALWISSSSIYPGILSFYPIEDSDPSRRPKLNILTMQEE